MCRLEFAGGLSRKELRAFLIAPASIRSGEARVPARGGGGTVATVVIGENTESILPYN